MAAVPPALLSASATTLAFAGPVWPSPVPCLRATVEEWRYLAKYLAPFDRQQTQPLRLTNTSTSQAVAFKVRTNAPKRFAVRPNSGLLPPGGSEELTVILHGGVEHDLAINQMREKNQQKDRFLVVGVPCDPSQVSGPESLAQISEPNPKKGPKLKVRYTFGDSSPGSGGSSAALASGTPAVPPSPVTSTVLASPAPSPMTGAATGGPSTLQIAAANPSSRAAASPRAASPARIKLPVGPVVEGTRPPPLTLSMLQTQVLKAKAEQEMAETAGAGPGAKQTNQEKYLSALLAKDSVVEQQMSNPERYAALFEERRKLLQRIEDLSNKYREAVAERDKLSGIVRELRGKQRPLSPKSDSSNMMIIVVVLVALLAYIFGRWRS